MTAQDVECLELREPDDIVLARQAVRRRAVALGFGLVDQTKIVTASSELARNTVDYGGGGAIRIESVRAGIKTGLRLTFEDQGPGIPDIQLALTDGYSTGQGMGLGLGGARRLSHEFDIQSTPGIGTRVTMLRWK